MEDAASSLTGLDSYSQLRPYFGDGTPWVNKNPSLFSEEMMKAALEEKKKLEPTDWRPVEEQRKMQRLYEFLKQKQLYRRTLKEAIEVEKSRKRMAAHERVARDTVQLSTLSPRDWWRSEREDDTTQQRKEVAPKRDWRCDYCRRQSEIVKHGEEGNKQEAWAISSIKRIKATQMTTTPQEKIKRAVC